MNMEYTIAISKESVAEMPMVTYDGKISVIDTAEKADTALDMLERETVVGFDTETRPAFRKGVTHNVALVQISTLEQSYLFRINITGIPARLRAFMENGDITKVGLSLRDDFNGLRRTEPNLTPEGFVDLQDTVKEYRITDSSLQKVYAIVFGERISKHQRLTNWEATELTPAQQAYAAIDAWACLKLHLHLESGAFCPEESAYKVIPTPEENDETETL
ncbi:MAG: 3'-5' exonuclease domain-containing protein 2 [Muribaculaceae bacterium]|nr:3'-5' exonuclease domain-containing protein 2 [Muribaculaceae bacterium]